MVRRLRLSTKLTLIVMIGLIATLAVGVPGAIERTDRERAATALPDAVSAVTSLVGFQELVNREATLSAWFVATGEPTARRALADARPRTDRAARELGRSGTSSSPRTAPVERAWRALRVERASIDRRVISDVAALAPFDRIADAVRGALDGSTTVTREPVAGVERSRVGLSELDTAMAREQSALVIGTARAAMSPPLVNRLRAAAADQDRLRGSVLASARRELGPRGDAAIAAVQSALPPVRALRNPALLGFVPFVTPEQWLQRSNQQLHALEGVGRSLDTTAAVRARARVTATRTSIVRWTALVAAVFAGVVVVGMILHRAIRRPIQAVASAATDLAARRREPEESGALTRAEPLVAPVAVRTNDEVGDIARALHALDAAMAESPGTPRRSVRNDISDLYLNIARRNQPLLNRQLSLIDELEASEHDPDRLASLVQLDHLAARMHRNSESLLVLAGLDRGRTHTEPVALLDVVRGAVSEVEDFGRVDVVGVPVDIAVVGRIAADLAHVLAEIIENATAYSPPESRVFISAGRRPEAIELTISDEGVGLPVDQLDALNEQLTHPPLPGVDLSRSLGLVVVARLCERIGVNVTLRSSAGTGTAAVVSVPMALVIDAQEDEGVIEELPAPEPPPVFVDLTANEPTAPEIHFTPVPLEDDPDLLPNPNGSNGRNGRRPSTRAPVGLEVATPPFPVLLSPPPPPARRSPNAVFELVARYQAGRRRADHDPPGADADPS